MVLTQQLSIVIPVRIDSPERLANLQAIVRFLVYYTEGPIILLEADAKSNVKGLIESCRVQLIFREDTDPIFHRTKYINELLHMAQTQFVGVWDTDVVLDPDCILDALHIMNQGHIMCLPYNGKFVFLTEDASHKARRHITTLFQDKLIETLDGVGLGRPSVGGAYIVNKTLYLQAGGENEGFYGWGPEDAERVKRLEVLGYQIIRTEGSLYHLHHPRGINSTLGEDIRGLQNLCEFGRICGMTPKELRKHIGQTLPASLCYKKKLVVVGNKDTLCPAVDTFDYVIRVNRMTNYGNTGYRTDALYLEANNTFKATYTGDKLRERITKDTHILMNPYWHRRFEEWPTYLSAQQYALTELIDYELIGRTVGCSNPTSGVALLVHLLSTEWSENYDIHIVGFELQNRANMIDNEPYWAWHHGAGEAESVYLNNCVELGLIKPLDVFTTL